LECVDCHARNHLPYLLVRWMRKSVT
jgi:hypothetical protein